MHCTVVGGCWMHCVGWDRGCWCWGSCTARRQQSAAVNRGQLLLLLPRTFLVLYLSVFMQISFKHFVSSFRKIDQNVSRGRFAEAFLVLYSRSYRWPCKSFSRFHFVFSFRSDSSQIYLNVLDNSVKFGFLETLQLLVLATADAGIIAAADILVGSTCTFLHCVVSSVSSTTCYVVTLHIAFV